MSLFHPEPGTAEWLLEAEVTLPGFPGKGLGEASCWPRAPRFLHHFCRTTRKFAEDTHLWPSDLTGVPGHFPISQGIPQGESPVSPISLSRGGSTQRSCEGPGAGCPPLLPRVCEAGSGAEDTPSPGGRQAGGQPPCWQWPWVGGRTGLAALQHWAAGSAGADQREGGREGRFGERMDLLCGLRRGPSHQQTVRETAPHKFQRNPLQEGGAAGPELSPSSDTARSLRSQHAHLCDPESSAHLWAPQPRGSRAPASTPPCPHQESGQVQLCRKQL